MELKSTDSRSSTDPSRCRHTFANSQRCRLPPGESSQYCARHAKLPQNQTDTEDTASLTAGLTDFTTAWPVNQFLSRLLLLLGQNRISPRRAAVLAYVASQILRTIAAMDHEDERQQESPADMLRALMESTPPVARELEFMASEQAHIERARAAREKESLHSQAAPEYRSTYQEDQTGAPHIHPGNVRAPIGPSTPDRASRR